MTYFIKNGNRYTATSEKSLDIHDKLPAGFYALSFHPDIGFYFQESEPFSMPSKFYGNDLTKVDRIFKTFNDRNNSTGVILSGEKGSGKTLLGKVLAQRMVDAGNPVITVTSAFSGDSFLKVIQSIDQDAMVFFDEFEKTYPKNEDQEGLLTLFDGVFSSKKLFVVTCNKKYLISEYIINRPSRFFYSFSYAGLDETFIRDYLDINLINKTHVDDFVKIALMFEAFNFDMLQSLVQEMNRYDETPKEAITYLNIDASQGTGRHMWEVTSFEVNGRKLDLSEIRTKEIEEINPVFDQIDIEVPNFSVLLETGKLSPYDIKTSIPANADGTLRHPYMSVYFDPEDVRESNSKEFAYKTEQNGMTCSAVIRRKKHSVFDYRSLL